MPAYSSDIGELIDQTGIETIFGATPVQLPRLSAQGQRTLQTGGLMGLKRAGMLNVDADLLQRDPTLAQSGEALGSPDAVVRVDRSGTGSKSAQFWVFVKDDHIVQLTADGGRGAHFQLHALADSSALFVAIERLFPLSSMPHKAFARAVLNPGDARDVFDQAQGTGFNVAYELLVSDGLDEEDARVAFDIMRTSALGGHISFMRLRDNMLTLTYGVAVGQDGGDIWMAFAAPLQTKNLVLETVLEGAFQTQLNEGWVSLKAT